MVVPVYIGETSPSGMRGYLVVCFDVMLTFGKVASNLLGGLFSYAHPEIIGWRLMFGFGAVPAVIQLFGFLFIGDSPQSMKTDAELEEHFNRIYNSDREWIKYELRGDFMRKLYT